MASMAIPAIMGAFTGSGSSSPSNASVQGWPGNAATSYANQMGRLGLQGASWLPMGEAFAQNTENNQNLLTNAALQQQYMNSLGQLAGTMNQQNTGANAPGTLGTGGNTGTLGTPPATTSDGGGDGTLSI